jgi:hypothetical protein
VDATISIENQVAVILSVSYMTTGYFRSKLTLRSKRLSGVEQQAEKSSQNMSQV